MLHIKHQDTNIRISDRGLFFLFTEGLGGQTSTLDNERGPYSRRATASREKTWLILAAFEIEIKYRHSAKKTVPWRAAWARDESRERWTGRGRLLSEGQKIPTHASGTD